MLPLGITLKGREKFRGKFPDAEEAESVYSLLCTDSYPWVVAHTKSNYGHDAKAARQTVIECRGYYQCNHSGFKDTQIRMIL